MFILLFWMGVILLVLGIASWAYRAKWRRRLGLSETVVTSGLVLMIVGGVLKGITWLTQWDWDWTHLSNLFGITQSNASQVQVLVTILAGLVALGIMLLIIRQLTITERSLRQATRASLDMVRTERNWKLFEHKVDPGLPKLPSPVGNEEYWKWRVVHLDHLSLLHTQWVDYGSGAIGDEEIKGWIDWAQLLLGELQNDRQDAIKKLGSEEPAAEPKTTEIMEFAQTSLRLRALLHISELHNWDLFPPSFVTWLLDKCNFRSLGLREKE